jgi:ABC-type branched-subunit amino acid transport system ATPase component/predicted MFS family arabinose efflux permease
VVLSKRPSAAGVERLVGVIVADEDLIDEPGEAGPSLAVDDATTDAPSFLRTVGPYGFLPLVVLTILNLVDELDRVAIVTLGPEIRDAFHLSDAALGAIAGLGGFVVVLAALPLAVLGDRRRRLPIVGITAVVWAAFSFLTGLVRSTAQLAVVRMLSGVGKGSVEPVHTSLLVDYYPVDARGRVLAIHRSANPIAAVLGPLIAGGVAAIAGGSAGWRWPFIVFAPMTIVPAAFVLLMREPQRGVHEGLQPGGSGASPDGKGPQVKLATAFKRLLDIRSLRYMYIGIGVLGFGLVGAPVLVSLYLEESWKLAELSRGVFFSVGSIGPAIGLLVGGKVGDRFFRHHPAWPLFLLGIAVPVWSFVVVGSLYLPQLWLVSVGWNIAGLLIGLALPAFLQLVAATAPPAFRSLAFSLFGIFLYICGGFFGPLLLGGISDASSPRTALSTLVIPGVIAGVLLVRGARFVKGDIAMVAADIAETHRAAAARATQGGGTNAIEIRNLDFSYGSTQVLFGVDLDVPDGEIVALLGTNGAGKSTLLRVLTGLDHPTRGQVRYDGRDITYLEAEQILELGIVQMPGGRAIFPGMSVEENLRVGTFTFRRNRDRVERDIEEVYAIFPVLRQRRRQLASTLSGGEQQMLALGKAFLLHPKVLCIDELSLGLAPAVIGELLTVVREIHSRGTTVVIVEQSFNIALQLAKTAVFMEKGEVRYAGPANDLRNRPDLLRSVFLGRRETSRSQGRRRVR